MVSVVEEFPVVFKPKRFGEPSPVAPEGYRYGGIGGNFTMFCDGERIPSPRYLIPDSGCLFDAEDKYSQRGVIHAREFRGAEYWDIRFQVCACKKCREERVRQ